MSAPIPVFTFVFAAYAATCPRGTRYANLNNLTPLNSRASFRTAWRSQASGGAAIFVKLGRAKGSEAHERRLAAASSNEASEEFWVSDIVETRLGFTGARTWTRTESASAADSPRVHFHIINVLDWRIGAQAQGHDGQKRPDEESLVAELAESART